MLCLNSFLALAVGHGRLWEEWGVLLHTTLGQLMVEIPNRKSSTTSFFRDVCCCCSVTKSHLTLCDPMNYSPPGSSVHGISQARILERVAISFSRESYQLRDWTHVSCLSCIGRQILYHCTPGKLINNFIIHFYRNLNV